MAIKTVLFCLQDKLCLIQRHLYGIIIRMEVKSLLASLDLNKTSFKDILNSHGLDINENSLYTLIFLVVTVLFVYGSVRALYQWLAPKFGITTPNRISNFLFIDKIKENNGKAQFDKWSWKTFLLISLLVIFTRVFIYYTIYALKVTQAVEAGYASYGFFDSFKNLWIFFYYIFVFT